MRRVIGPALLAMVAFACTGGGGSLDGDGGTGSSSSTSSGGASNEQIRASDFDQSCTGDGDCVVVYEGAICNECGCPNAAIARTAQAAYVSRRQSASCPVSEAPCANDCADAVAVCGQGTCSMTRD